MFHVKHHFNFSVSGDLMFHVKHFKGESE